MVKNVKILWQIILSFIKILLFLVDFMTNLLTEMETITLRKKTSIYSIFFIVLALIVGVEYFVVQQPQFYEPSSFIPYAVGIDLLIMIPILYYFLIVKRLKQHILTLVFGVSLSVTVSYFILPKSHYFIIEYAEKLLVILEILFVGYVLIKAKSIIEEYRRLNINHYDFIGNLKKSFQKNVGVSPLINFLVSELIMLRYGLFFWIKAKKSITDNEFTIHQNSGFIALFSVLIFVSVIECCVIHLLVGHYYETLAWILTAISIYSLVFLVAHLFAVIDQRISIDASKIFVRVGFFWNFEIQKSHIDKVEIIKKDIDKTTEDELNTCKLLLTQPNIAIYLTEKYAISGIYGLKREVNVIYLCVDDGKRFVEML